MLGAAVIVREVVVMVVVVRVMVVDGVLVAVAVERGSVVVGTAVMPSQEHADEYCDGLLQELA